MVASYKHNLSSLKAVEFNSLSGLPGANTLREAYATCVAQLSEEMDKCVPVLGSFDQELNMI